MARIDYDVRRATGVGPIAQTGRTHAWVWGGAAQAGLRYPLGGFMFGPRVGLGFTDVSVDAYQEAGAAARYALRRPLGPGGQPRRRHAGRGGPARPHRRVRGGGLRGRGRL
ncbi:MAG: autotransporter domain-containing protein [Caulobacteraceae bacterium]